MRKSEWIAGGLGGAMVLAVAGVFGVTHYNVLLHRAGPQSAAADPDATGLKFPSVDDMCKAAGATGADLQQCLSDETSAAEFVGAWMELNGFIANGRIDIEQIQLQAELAAADQGLNLPAGDPLDPLSDATADLTQDPLPSSPDADPLAPPSGGGAMPPAQVAMLCLSTASDDWLKMHDCIAQNDPSSTLDGN